MTEQAKTCKSIDVTPCAATNWRMDGGPILIVNPDATMHQKLSLAWSMSQELEAIAELGIGSSNQGQSICDLLHDKSMILAGYLYELAASTADQKVEGGGA
jgi:hypothetical protein